MLSSHCIFCSIARKEIPATILYEDEEVVMFPDKFPKSPTHLLLVPKVHIDSILSIDEKTRDIPGMLISKAKEFAEAKGIPGYKLTFHVGREGGQVIDHLHLHLMAERKV
jgi:histidine triad (HIT) family protein